MLSDTALRAADIDEAEALKAKERAEKELADNKGDVDYARAESELAEAIAKIQAIRNIKKKLGKA